MPLIRVSDSEGKPHSTKAGRRAESQRAYKRQFGGSKRVKSSEPSRNLKKEKKYSMKQEPEGYNKGGHVNTRRENRLEELGRVDAERAYTSKGKRNLRDEKHRIRGELKKGGRATKSPSDTPRRQAGPAAPSRPRKRIKTHGGGPDSGNIGKLKDVLSKHRKMPTLPKLPDLSKLKKRMPKYMKPLKGGGSAKKPRPHGPHMWVRGDKRKKYAEGGSVGAAVRGKGCEIK